MAVSFENDGWVYDMYPSDTPPVDCGDFAAFKRMWDDKRDGEALPAWGDYQFEDFDGWYGWVVVEDILPGDEYDSVFRLWGTKVANFYSRDLTNRRLREFEGDVFTRTDIDMRAQMAQTHEFRICSGPVDWKSESKWDQPKGYSFIQLPLADQGRTADRFIALCRPFDREPLVK